MATWGTVIFAVYVVTFFFVVSLIVTNLQAFVYLAKNFRYLVVAVSVAVFAAAVAYGVQMANTIRLVRENIRGGVLTYKSNDVAPGVTKNDIKNLINKGGIDYLRSSASVVALNLIIVSGGTRRRLYGEFTYVPGFIYSETKAVRVVVTYYRPSVVVVGQNNAQVGQNAVMVGQNKIFIRGLVADPGI